MRSVVGRCAARFASSTDWGWPVPSSIPCECGIAIERLCHCHRNLLGRCGKNSWGEKSLAETKAAQIENPSRSRILQQIRSGLSDGIAEPAAASGGVMVEPVIFAPIANPLERFQQECVSNLMECALTADGAASAQHLAQVLESLPAGEIFVQDHPLLRQLVERNSVEQNSGLAAPARAIRWSSDGAPAEASQATVTLAEALIAQTGSILVTAACGGRGASVIAPCHIVYATMAQLVPDLTTALSRVSREHILDSNSFACVISGSSRTADIEKILVQGAHGPRRLVVILQTTT